MLKTIKSTRSVAKPKKIIISLSRNSVLNNSEFTNQTNFTKEKIKQKQLSLKIW